MHSMIRISHEKLKDDDHPNPRPFKSARNTDPRQITYDADVGWFSFDTPTLRMMFGRP